MPARKTTTKTIHLSVGPAAQLYTIDPSTGAATAVGPLNLGFVFEGGLVWDGTTMWGVNAGDLLNPTLFSVNLTTGTGRISGVIAAGEHDFAGLSIFGGNLYGVERVTSALWMIDTSNPANSAQVGGGLGGGIVMGSTGGMAGHAAYASGSNTIFRVNFATGAGSPLSNPGVTFSALARPPQPGDCDGDGDVDLVDYACFADCLTGPGGGLPTGCDTFDLDSDTDADLFDFAGFSIAFTG